MKLRSVVSTCCLWIAVPLAIGQRDVLGGQTAVNGRVSYADGSPVVGAQVEVRTFGPIGRILPDPVYTDNQGHYKVVYPALGPGFIGASKLDEGYPNPLLALYNLRIYTGLKQIDLEPGQNLDKIDLVLQDPKPILLLKVQDAVSGQVISDASIWVAWTDDPEIILSRNMSSDGIAEFVLPDHSISIKIAAPGHREWHWNGDAQIRAQTKGRGGVKLPIQVALEPH